jgi:SPP1 gp7 family putative phage head morphogenesis protein
LARKPVWQFPIGAERDYEQVLRTMVSNTAALSKSVVAEKYSGWLEKSTASAQRGDAEDDYSVDIEYAILILEMQAKEEQRKAILQLAAIFALLNAFNDLQFRKQVKAGTGADIAPAKNGLRMSNASMLGLKRSEPFMQGVTDNWIAQNTNLIKNLSGDQLKSVETIIRQGIMQSKPESLIAQELQDSLSIPKNRATLIASDQVSKANSVLTALRLQSVGVKDYIWTTRADDRVRPEHAHRNGHQFSFDKPPPDGNPGYPIRCRCWAKPIWS